MINAEDLKRLGAGRWLIPLLAQLLEQGDARFAVLLSGLEIARDSLVRTLDQAIGNGWVMRNPGYGHPLRPEYMLTTAGRTLAGPCLCLMQARQRLALAPQHLPRWAMPILGRLETGGTRFSSLLAELAPVTPRALSLSLKQMIEGGIVLRELEDSFPPSALYHLAPPGYALLHCLAVP